jgi:protein-S-isoprenylcysteine O-methyltransferase Ste14
VAIFGPVWVRVVLFVLISAALVRISWRPLHNPRCHGFYRFFAFEGIAVLLFLNIPYWFKDIYSLHQSISWILLFASLAFVVSAVHRLRRFGGSEARTEHPENFAFENTTHLVTTGIYRYIRHPMYSSLGLLVWGIFPKHVSPVGFFIAVVSTGFLMIAAKIEERENIAFFGPRYIAYGKRSKMFIPYLF